jgi:hypothetical protein
MVDPLSHEETSEFGLTMSLDGSRTILTAGAAQDGDVVLYVHRAGGVSLRFDWDPMFGASPTHDLYAADLALARNRGSGNSMRTLACGLPPGPGSTVAADGSASDARFYLLSCPWPEGVVLSTDSLGRTRLRTAPCQ